ncbi:MAG: TIGR01212 family radical SAM protein [Deltaproteobacteria bacterium]|nr:TIGR01212 family radical SAM protein [Deltaproteobacteria bacterium]
MGKPCNLLSDYIKDRFGCKVFKVTVNAGLTCPNKDGVKGSGGCIYCAEPALMPKEYNGADVAGQLDAGIRYVRERHRAEKFIAYFQINSNTYAPVAYLREIYGEAMRHPEVAGIAISTRPDCVDENLFDLLARLKEEKFLWLELGLQSANADTLARINRRHTVGEFEAACRGASAKGIDVCAHVIIGLPEETREDFLSTMRLLARLNVWGVKFHQLQVLRGTRLEEEYNAGRVMVLGLEEYARLVVDCIETLPPSMIVHRLFGDAPQQYLVAPRWGANKFIVMDRIMKTFAERGTRQGARSAASAVGG